MSLLWFDVGIKRYTTLAIQNVCYATLWFDVGIKRYTTLPFASRNEESCGLM